ncbi:hypothetical protein [Schaalia odontolytica]
MSDPINQYPASDQPAYGQAPQGAYGQAPQGAYGQAPQGAYGQPAYGQAPQGAYGQPGYAVNPALEKIRSNASTVRIASILSFVFGGLILSGAMWYWANKMTAEAQALGAPLDIATELNSARNAAKICSIIHIVILVVVVLFYVIGIIAILATGGSNY